MTDHLAALTATLAQASPDWRAPLAADLLALAVAQAEAEGRLDDPRAIDAVLARLGRVAAMLEIAQRRALAMQGLAVAHYPPKCRRGDAVLVSAGGRQVVGSVIAERGERLAIQPVGALWPVRVWRDAVIRNLTENPVQARADGGDATWTEGGAA